MADEPGGWELKRSHEQLRQDMRDGFNQLGQRLDKVVTAEAFAAEQRRVDDKHRDLADDIAAERAQRIAAIADEKAEREKGDAAQQAALDKLIANQKWIIAAVFLPLVFFVVSTLIATGVI
jgi:hypothetical protein